MLSTHFPSANDGATSSNVTPEQSISNKIKSALVKITKIGEVGDWKFNKEANAAFIITSTEDADAAYEAIEAICATAKDTTKVKLHKDQSIKSQTLQHNGLIIKRGQAATEKNKNNKMVSVKGISGGAENLFKILNEIAVIPGKAKDKKSDSGESASIDKGITLRFVLEQTLDGESQFADEKAHNEKSLADKLAKFPDAWEYLTLKGEYLLVPTRIIKAALQNDNTAVKKSNEPRVIMIEQCFPLYASKEEFDKDLSKKLTHLAGGTDCKWLVVKDNNVISYLAEMDKKVLDTFNKTCEKYKLEVDKSVQEMSMGVVKRCDVYEKLMLKEKGFSRSLTIFNQNLGGNRVQTAGGATRANTDAAGNSPSTTTLVPASSMGVKH